MEIDRIEALNVNSYCYDALMTLSEQSRQDLQWLLNNLKDASAPVMQSKPDFTIYTDASNAGWGWLLNYCGVKLLNKNLSEYCCSYFATISCGFF